MSHDLTQVSRRPLFVVSLQNWVVSLTFLRRAAGRVSGPGGKHLPAVLPAQPGPQEQNWFQLSARHDVCRCVHTDTQQLSLTSGSGMFLCRQFVPLQ